MSACATHMRSMLRGYGQLFLCPSLLASALILAAQLVISPSSAAWSVAGALLFSLGARPLRPDPGLWRAGLFSVNGILLGLAWFYVPELQLATRLLVFAPLCLAGGAGLAWASRRLRLGDGPLPLFSLPYVLLFWLLLSALGVVGRHDAALGRGWLSLRAGFLLEARQQFESAETTTPLARAHREDGLGWSLYMLGDGAGALEHFQAALVADSTFADAWDGLGWTRRALGDYLGASEAFHGALRHNPHLADAWDGLGWLELERGAWMESHTAFTKALWSAPLLADAWKGRAAVALAEGRAEDAARASRMAERLTALPQPIFLSGRLLLALALMALAVLIHSRLSFLVLVAAVALPSLMALAGLPVPRSLDFHTNLAALAIGLGGHYLKPGRGAWLTLAVVLPLFTLAWNPLADLAWRLGLPMLSLPFNLAVLLVLGGVWVVQRHLGRPLWVPLEVAMQGPSAARRWSMRVHVAKTAWERIDKVKNEDLRAPGCPAEG